MTESKFIEPFDWEPDKARLKAAIMFEPADRVPHIDNLIEDKHVEKLLGRYAGNTLSYGGDPAKGPSETQSRPMYPDDFIDLCNIIGQDIISFDAGMWTPFKRKNENGNLVQVTDRSVKDNKDFSKLVFDSENEINKVTGYIREYKDAVKRRKSKLGVCPVYGCILQTLYEFVVGMDDFMMMAYEDRKLVDEMLEASTVHFVKLTKDMISQGMDFLFLGDDVAFKTGLFLPPQIMKDIWVPRIARIIEPAVNSNIPVLFHSDGKIDVLVQDLIDIGVNCINPLDPYCIDYREYKKKFGKNIALCGNIDIEFPLSKGTPEDVEKDVKEHMEVLKPGYGYVSDSSHSIVNYIPHKNYIAYINSVHKYGKY